MFGRKVVALTRFCHYRFPVCSLSVWCVAAWSILLCSPILAEDRERQLGLIVQVRDQHGTEVVDLSDCLSLTATDLLGDGRLSTRPIFVRWGGFLQSQADGSYQFSVYTTGHVRLTIAGEVVLDQQAKQPNWLKSDVVPLEFGEHSITLEYRPLANNPHLLFCWSGPGFVREPVPAAQFFHASVDAPIGLYRRGAELYRALRCGACHSEQPDSDILPAPSLALLATNVKRDWLVKRLTQTGDGDSRRMPHFALDKDQAVSIANHLYGISATVELPEFEANHDDVVKGRELFREVGCLACHQVRTAQLVTGDVDGLIGRESLFDGGELSRVAAKRPPNYFAEWLRDPKRLNPNHRMPVFSLGDEERRAVAAFLGTLGHSSSDSTNESSTVDAEGARLVRRFRCGACHELPAGGASQQLPEPPVPVEIGAARGAACWQSLASSDSHRPYYELSQQDQIALQRFMDEYVRTSTESSSPIDGRQQLREHNCLGCHSRNGQVGLERVTAQLATADADVARIIDDLRPPDLTSVGDKLRRQALTESIAAKGPSRRDWLRIRMPRFAVTANEIAAIADHFIAEDRMSDEQSNDFALPTDQVSVRLAGSRLVTSHGFGCVSCHAIGSVEPQRPAPGTRGPDLDGISDRVRRSWFERFVRNPTRIVRQLEMPSIRTAVRGVLDEDLSKQLAAVWQVLADPEFEPPLPSPVRVVRHVGGRESESDRVAVITDVTRVNDDVVIKPFLVGLPNRHSLLYDLQGGALVRWSVGDVANQRTQGKVWYWQAVGEELMSLHPSTPELALARDSVPWQPVVDGQFMTRIDTYQHIGGGVRLSHRLRFCDAKKRHYASVGVEQTWRVLPVHDALPTKQTGIRRRVAVSGLSDTDQMQLRVLPTNDSVWQVEGTFGRTNDGQTEIRIVSPSGLAIGSNGWVTLPKLSEGKSEVVLEYVSKSQIDTFPLLSQLPTDPEIRRIDAVPGYQGQRLALTDEMMPIALAWDDQQVMYVGSLKGRVWQMRDLDGDHLEETENVFSDELASPYGLATGSGYVDVLTKYAVLRLNDRDGDGFAEHVASVARGWGHTADYHDWAVGLPRDSDGRYYVAIPCQQDDRTEAAARFRGTVLLLEPRLATVDDPTLFETIVFAAGQRFPMGIALNRRGQLFTTDNQGNYNPFNELNHIQRGRHYGFINARQRIPGYQPTMTRAAINIPHPWTRSVNGICFLETPAELRERGGDVFGPFEGHLVGCEYDTRRLIRMTLQDVDGTIQGAAYPFSVTQADNSTLGPISVAVSPDGGLYMGGILDSGWGGGNNVGEIVRFDPQIDRLPHGICEVLAVADGIEVRFTRPVDLQLAAQLDNYIVESFFRIPTPAYGGDDYDRRQHRLTAVTVADDGLSLRLSLNDLSVGRVYHLRLQSLINDEVKFFPAEAYLTVKAVPEP